MMTYKVINIILFFSTLYIGWWLYFDLFKKLRVDITRRKLFGVRNELFYLAINGTLPFNSKAYGLCRKTINGYIRFCHKLTHYRFLVYRIFQGSENRIMTDHYNEVKECAKRELNEEQKKALDEIYYKIHEIMATHILKTSLLLTIITNCLHAIFKIFKILEEAKNIALRKTAPSLSTIDAKAKQYGSEHLDPAQLKLCKE
jgi:hypothetical protein